MAQAIVAFVAKVASVVAKAYTLYKASAVVRLLVQVAVLFAAKSLVKKPSADFVNQGVELSLKYESALPREVAIGYTATAGSLHFTHTWTNDSKVPNKYIERVIAISDIPIQGCVGVYADGKPLTFSGDINTGRFECMQFRSKNNQARLWMRFYPGSYTPVADSYLQGVAPGLWTADHKGVGIAYVVITKEYDADAFPNGAPDFVFVVNGARVYDDRYDGSKPGRTGSQRLNDPSTYVFTQNVAVNLAQYLRGFKVNGKTIVGVGAEDEDMPDAMLLSAYNVCDQAVEGATAGSTEARYRCGMMIRANETARDILPHFTAAYDGTIYDRGGVITLLPGAIRTSIMSIDDNEIIIDGEKSWQPKASLDSLYNFVTGSYVDSVNGFQEGTIPPRSNPTWEGIDGQRFERNVGLRAVPYLTQAQRITKRIHEYSRLQGTVAFEAPLHVARLEQGDWFTLSSTRWNFTNKLFEVVSCELNNDLNFSLIAKEVSASTDNWGHADFYASSVTAVDIKPRTFPVPTLTLTPISVTNAANNVSIPAIRVVIGNVDDQGPSDYVLVEYQQISPLIATVYAIQAPATTNAQLIVTQGIVSSNQYQFRAKTISLQGQSDWSNWVSVTAPATFIVPVAGTVSTIGGISESVFVSTVNDSIQEVVNARRGIYANLLDSVSAAALSASWLQVSGRPLTLNDLDSAARSELTTLRDNVVIAPVNEYGASSLSQWQDAWTIVGTPNATGAGIVRGNPSSFRPYPSINFSWTTSSATDVATIGPKDYATGGQLFPAVGGARYAFGIRLSSMTGAAGYVGIIGTWLTADNVAIGPSWFTALGSLPIGASSIGGFAWIAATAPANAVKASCYVLIQRAAGNTGAGAVEIDRIWWGRIHANATTAPAWTTGRDDPFAYARITDEEIQRANADSALSLRSSRMEALWFNNSVSLPLKPEVDLWTLDETGLATSVASLPNGIMQADGSAQVQGEQAAGMKQLFDVSQGRIYEIILDAAPIGTNTPVRLYITSHDSDGVATSGSPTVIRSFTAIPVSNRRVFIAYVGTPPLTNPLGVTSFADSGAVKKIRIRAGSFGDEMFSGNTLKIYSLGIRDVTQSVETAASVVDEAAARASADSAMAYDISQLNATVNDVNTGLASKASNTRVDGVVSDFNQAQSSQSSELRAEYQAGTPINEYGADSLEDWVNAWTLRNVPGTTTGAAISRLAPTGTTRLLPRIRLSWVNATASPAATIGPINGAYADLLCPCIPGQRYAFGANLAAVEGASSGFFLQGTWVDASGSTIGSPFSSAIGTNNTFASTAGNRAWIAAVAPSNAAGCLVEVVAQRWTTGSGAIELDQFWWGRIHSTAINPPAWTTGRDNAITIARVAAEEVARAAADTAIAARASTLEAQMLVTSRPNLLINGFLSRNTTGWNNLTGWNIVALRDVGNVFQKSFASASTASEDITSEFAYDSWRVVDLSVQAIGTIVWDSINSTLDIRLEGRDATTQVWSTLTTFATHPVGSYAVRQYRFTGTSGFDRIRFIWRVRKNSTTAVLGSTFFQLGPALVTIWSGQHPPFQDNGQDLFIYSDVKTIEAAQASATDAVSLRTTRMESLWLSNAPTINSRPEKDSWTQTGIGSSTAVPVLGVGVIQSDGSAQIQGNNVSVGWRGLVSVVPGRVYEVTVDMEITNAGDGSLNRYIQLVSHTDAEAATSGAPWTTVFGPLVTTTGRTELTARFSTVVPSPNPFNIIGIVDPTTVTRIRVMAGIFGGGSAATAKVYSVSWRDITASNEVRASLTTEEVTRANADSALSGRATRMETLWLSNAPAVVVRPERESWTTAGLGSPTNVPSLPTSGNGAIQTDGSVLVQGDNIGAGWKALMPVSPGRIYQITADIEIVNVGDGSLNRRLLVISHDDFGNATAGNPYADALFPTVTTVGRQTVSAKFSTVVPDPNPLGILPLADISNIRAIRIMAAILNGGASAQAKIFSLSFADVTDSGEVRATLSIVEGTVSSQGTAIASTQTILQALGGIPGNWSTAEVNIRAQALTNAKNRTESTWFVKTTAGANSASIGARAVDSLGNETSIVALEADNISLKGTNMITLESAQVRINGNLVSTNSIVANAVSEPVGMWNPNTVNIIGGWTNVASIVVTVPTDAKVLLSALAQYFCVKVDTVGPPPVVAPVADVRFRLKRDSTVLFDGIATRAPAGPYEAVGVVPFVYADWGATAGTFTYTLDIDGSDFNSSAEASGRALNADIRKR